MISFLDKHKLKLLGLGVLGAGSVYFGVRFTSQEGDYYDPANFEGYSERPAGQLVSFTKEKPKNQREKANYTGLGCQDSIFEKRNYPEFGMAHSSEKPEGKTPSTEFGYSGWTEWDRENLEQPLIGCSTAFVRKGDNDKNIYEFELAIKKGDRGFIEKIFVDNESITSQFVFYVRNTKERSSGWHEPEFPFVNVFGLQRQIKQPDKSNGTSIYKVGNPEESGDNIWKDLNLSQPENKQRYFSVWVEGQEDEDIFSKAGIKSNNKIFSAVARKSDTPSENDYFRYFGSSGAIVGATAHTTVFYDLSILSNLSENVMSSKGSWKGIKEFCSTSKSKGRGWLSNKEGFQFREYCYEKNKAQK